MRQGVRAIGFGGAVLNRLRTPPGGQIVLAQNGQTRMTTTKQYDALNRLTNLVSTPSGAGQPTISSAYAYNDANQRIRRTEADSSYWLYTYDGLGQVLSGKKYWSDGTPVAGQQFTYTFDDIGNRKTAAAGGDQSGGNLRSATYTANTLNRYTQRTVPGYANIVGSANSSATVTVNNTPTVRKGEYFRGELMVANVTGPAWQALTNLAVLNNGANPDIVSNVTGNVFVPKTPEPFGYDADGNLTSDGRWTYTWDAENRLTKVESLATGPTASKRKVEWTYDGQGRRIRQTTYDGSSGSYVVTEDLKLVHDGWRCLAELNSSFSLLHSFVWGLDLSGTMDGAGGVGGLLFVTRHASPITSHFAAYDGNGNVVALVKAADGTVSAVYEYDPFGQTLRATGPMANENPFRFSTKRTDNTTGLVLYEYRVYSASLGRWLSRDPISERGGMNLYGFVNNDAIAHVDASGLMHVRDVVAIAQAVNAVVSK
jgi:RHS repeat-associated protein